MGCKYILEVAGEKMGMDPANSNIRPILLRFLNEAALELYEQADAPDCMWEQCFKVNGDQTVTMPHYVGEVRAFRELASQTPWSINQMRPRYNQFNWQDQWRNFRIKGKGPLMCTVTNQSIITISVPFVESPPIVVTLTGPTVFSTEANEEITMASPTMTSTNQYLTINSFKKDRVSTYNVIIQDVDGKKLSEIPNNQLEAQYQIIDVSLAPWIQNNQSPLDHYVEGLYKKVLPIFSNDSDEYPAPGCDYILINKMCQLWAEEQEKTEVAVGYDAKATRSLARKNENRNRETEDKVALTANPHDTLLPRIRSGVGKYRYWRGRYY